MDAPGISFAYVLALIYAIACYAYTAPASFIENFLTQTEMSPDTIESKLETYESTLVIEEEVSTRLGRDRVARLFEVEPELIQFLTEYRKSSE